MREDHLYKKLNSTTNISFTNFSYNGKVKNDLTFDLSKKQVVQASVIASFTSNKILFDEQPVSEVCPRGNI